MAFPEVRGQELASGFLRRGLARGRVSHAYLFLGPPGVGQETLALGLAQAFLCTRPTPEGMGCGECSGCHAVRGGTHTELTEVMPAGQSIGIDQVREVKGRAWYRPAGAGRRVILVREAQCLTEEAANSILCILEEPPAFLHFILMADEVNRLPSTLVSRCQVIPLRPLTPVLLEELLRSEDLAPGQERVVARLAAGSLERGRELATSGAAAQAREETLQVLETLAQGQGAVRWEVARILGTSSRLPLVLEQLLFWWRDAVLCKLQVADELWVNGDHRDRVANLAQSLSLEDLLYGLESVQNASRWLQENANPKLVGDVLAARLALSRLVSARSGGEAIDKSGRGAF